jgi:hypothetical protein
MTTTTGADSSPPDMPMNGDYVIVGYGTPTDMGGMR